MTRDFVSFAAGSLMVAAFAVCLWLFGRRKQKGSTSPIDRMSGWVSAQLHGWQMRWRERFPPAIYLIRGCYGLAAWMRATAVGLDEGYLAYYQQRTGRQMEGSAERAVERERRAYWEWWEKVEAGIQREEGRVDA